MPVIRRRKPDLKISLCCAAANTLFGVPGDMADRPTAGAVCNYLANSGAPNLTATLLQPGLSDGIGTWSGASRNINVIDQVTNPPVDNGGVMFQDSHIRITDVFDGTSHTALIAEHRGSTCSTGSTNTICTENSGTTCYAFWANADGTGGPNGAETSGNTVASDVCFTPLFGINGNGLGWTGTATIPPCADRRLPSGLSGRHQLGARGGCADIALCDGSVRYFNQSIQSIGSGTALPVLYSALPPFRHAGLQPAAAITGKARTCARFYQRRRRPRLLTL